MPTQTRRLAFTGFLMLILATPNSVMAQDAVRTFIVEDFGAIAGDNQDDGPAIRQAIDAAVASGSPAIVQLGEGIYRVAAERGRTCFPLRGAKNITIQGVGVETELLVTDPQVGVFSALVCENVLFRDFSIDYDPLPYTQGTIVGIDATAGTFDLDVQDGFPLLSEPWFAEASEEHGRWGMVFDAEQPRLSDHTSDHVRLDHWTHVKDRVWRVHAQTTMKSRVRQMQIGDRFVHLARGVGGTGVSINGCRDCGIEDVTIYSGPSTATVLVNNEGVHVRGLTVCRRPGTNRLLSTDADGIHCQRNRTGPVIEDCFFEAMADDSINIYTPPNLVLEVLSETELLVSAGVGIRPGDTVQIMNPREGTILGEVQVASVSVTGRRQLKLVLAQAVQGVQPGADYTTADTIYNLSACGAGFVIRNNRMTVHRRHGMLLRAGHGLVEGNQIDAVAGLGIVVTNEPNWPEGPFAQGITIRNNTITGVGYSLGYGSNPWGAAIQIKGTKLGHGLAAGHVQRDITIQNNHIINPPGAGIFIGAASNVTIHNNTIETTAEATQHRETAAVQLENADTVSIDNLTVTDQAGIFTAAVKIAPSVTVGKEGVTIGRIDATLKQATPQVIDQR